MELPPDDILKSLVTDALLELVAGKMRERANSDQLALPAKKCCAKGNMASARKESLQATHEEHYYRQLDEDLSIILTPYPPSKHTSTIANICGISLRQARNLLSHRDKISMPLRQLIHVYANISEEDRDRLWLYHDKMTKDMRSNSANNSE